MAEATEEYRRRDALIRAGLALASERSLPVVLQRIVELACDVSRARYGALGVVGDDGMLDQFLTHGISDAERKAIGDLPQGKGILGVLIHDARPLRLSRLQDDPRSIGFPPNHPRMERFLGVPIMISGTVFGSLYLTEKLGGEPFSEEDERDVSTLAAQAAITIENARLTHKADVRQRRLEALNRLTGAILEGRETQEVLQMIAGAARDLAGAGLATVAVPDESSPGELMVCVAEGVHADAVRGRRFPAENSISGEVMAGRTPLVLEDLAADERAGQPLVDLGRAGPALFVPLAAHERTFGTLAVANERGGPRFSSEQVATVQLFAAQAAVALEYAWVRGELQRLAVVEDRERIAKDLHDDIVQSLFAAGMTLQATESMADRPDVVRSRIGSVVDDIDRVIRDLRNYIFALRPGAVADRELDRALHELAAGFGDRAGTPTAVTVDPDAAARLSGRARDILQAAREALSNAVRHAGASSITLSLRDEGASAALEVRDDGAGFDPAAAAGTGQGLGNLRARAEALGGTLHIDSAAGRGTLVRIVVPYAPREAG